MIRRATLLVGVFVVMALSNGVVPVLPALAAGPALQSAIFSGYFLGAFVTVLPAGILSDRIGKVRLIRTGLALTLATGVFILLADDPFLILGARVIEGVGAGLFVPSAMSWVNALPDHTRMSGNFFASLNVGLLAGMVGSGWLADLTGFSLAGISAFTTATLVPLLLSVFLREPGEGAQMEADFIRIVREYVWLFAATVALVGVTGVVTTLYPEFTGINPSLVSVQIGLMNLATIVSVLVASRMDLEPVATIRVAAVAMAGAVLASYVTAVGLILVGAVAGFVIISQMTFLARTGIRQGVMMGLFNTSSYGGMTVLPFLAGVVAETVSFFAAFLVFAFIAGMMALTIGRCACASPVTR